MKNVLTALSLAAALLAAAPVTAGNGGNLKKKTTTATKPAEVLKVDPAASKIEWFATKVTGKHNGTVALQSGSVDVSKGALTGGSFVIDMTSIKVDDIKDAEYNGKLVGHLKSDDFFGVEANPTATFTTTSVAPIKAAKAGQPNYTVTGNLTIKGKTNPISFPATVVVAKDGSVAATGKLTVDRSKYDVRYGSNSFFDNLGDKAISNDMVFNVSVVAKK